MNNNFYNGIKKQVPLPAVDYCYELWEQQPFVLHIKNSRTSKLGDYRYDPKTKQHHISVNYDLNPYSFLITYIHEVAHRHTFAIYQNKVKPHGQQWKGTFKNLMLPILNNQVFPDDILRVLAQHMKNPKASSAADHKLTHVLGKYNNEEHTYLFELPEGQQFNLGKRSFKKGPLKRTRYLCEELRTKSAPVDLG